MYKDSVWTYEYFYTDHLGNTRVAYKADSTTLTKTSETSFDPWGVVLNGINQVNSFQNRFEFQNKEKESTFGLNRINLGARTINPTIGRFDGVDPLAEKNHFESPHVFVHNNPLIYVDPDGRDGIIVIKGGQLTISSNIYLYGAGATKVVAGQYQSGINARWGGTFSAQTSDGKRSFNVNVSVNVDLYQGKEKNNPWIIPEAWDPSNRDNFIEVGLGDKRSYVRGGDEGEWRSQGRRGMTLAQDNPAPHELGHLLGLDDKYTDKNGPNKGWENNIMGNSQSGKVEQRNINGILQDAIKAYETWSMDKNNAGKEFRYSIDINKPNKERENE